jgi:2-polyprenyl-6-hydroxyphenyl methylase/3-demethylubiquinone-9 3-methyltransferase
MRLAGFVATRPCFEIDQQRSLAWLAAAHAESEAVQNRLDDRDRRRFELKVARALERCACPPSKLARRGHSVPDIERDGFSDNELYALTRKPHGHGTELRMAMFAERVADYFTRAYEDERDPPDDLIHVTCTGYVSPSGAQLMVAHKGWGAATRVTHAYHMGCYAALPAVRMAAGFSAIGARRVDIVHTELCSLHLDPAGEHWLHALLFALHPIVLAAFGWLWWHGERTLLGIQLALVLAFLAYQVIYWNVLRVCTTRAIDNAWYAELGERWYGADDTPIALLRAEARHRNPWVADEIVRQLGPAACRVLDLGCGAGFLANHLALAGHQVTGIDTTPENLAVAHTHDTTGSVTYELGDACALRFADASFDVVCAMDLLEHVTEPERLVAEASRVLRPGGLFFFHTFNRTRRAHLIVIKGVEWFVKNTPKNLHVIELFRTPGELAAMCDRAGLAIHTLRGVRPRFGWPLWRMVLTGRVGDDFAFTFTPSLAIGYTGYAQRDRLDLRAAHRPHKRIVPEVHQRHDHRDRP